MKSENELDQVFAVVPARVEDGKIRKDNFDEMFAEAVYEGLQWTSGLVANILGSFLQDAMIYETGWGKSKRGIKDAATLEKSLERIFGFGAKVFEKKILEILYTKLQLSKCAQQSGHVFKFSKEVNKAKKLFKTKLSSDKRSINDRCKPSRRI